MDNNELKHGDWKDHKYIAKVPVGKDYRYFYEMSEYVAYLKGLPVEKLQDMAMQYDYSDTNVWASDMKDRLRTENNTEALVRLITDRTLGTDNGLESLSKLDKKTREFTPDEDWQVINEYYESGYGEEAYTLNCASCTAAYDLRRKGYDVVASGISITDDPPTVDELLSWYNAASYKDSYTNDNLKTVYDSLSLYSKLDDNESMKTTCKKAIINSLQKEFLKQGEGARGHFLLFWRGGGGHSVVYEIQNGKMIIRDCQTYKKYAVEEFVDECAGRLLEVGYIRTDNVIINGSILDRVENRTGVDRGDSVRRTERGSTFNYRYRQTRDRR